MRLAAVIFGVFLAAFTGQPSEVATSPTGQRIIHLTGPVQNPFLNVVARPLTETAKKLGMSVTVQPTLYDAAPQAQRIDDAIAQKYDSLDLTIRDNVAKFEKPCTF